MQIETRNMIYFGYTFMKVKYLNHSKKRSFVILDTEKGFLAQLQF